MEYFDHTTRHLREKSAPMTSTAWYPPREGPFAAMLQLAERLRKPYSQTDLHQALNTIAGLNAHYGRDTPAYATAGRREASKLRRDFMSPRYTTSWEELLRV